MCETRIEIFVGVILHRIAAYIKLYNFTNRTKTLPNRTRDCEDTICSESYCIFTIHNLRVISCELGIAKYNTYQSQTRGVFLEIGGPDFNSHRTFSQGRETVCGML